MHVALGDASFDDHRISSDIKHLLIEAVYVRDKSPVLEGPINVVSHGAKRCVLAPVVLDELTEVVIRVSEDMAELVRMARLAGNFVTPSADPRRARR